MKYLTLIRHSKSSWDDTSLKDYDRPLNERGLRQAPLVGRFLGKTYLGLDGSTPVLPRADQMVSSSAARAHATALLMQPELGVSSSSILLDERAYLAEPRVLLELVRNFSDAWHHVIFFGHNPGISDFADKLVKRGGVDQMPTSAAALLELPWDAWSATDWNEARLVGYITPRLIEKRFSQP